MPGINPFPPLLKVISWYVFSQLLFQYCYIANNPKISMSKITRSFFFGLGSVGWMQQFWSKQCMRFRSALIVSYSRALTEGAVATALLVMEGQCRRGGCGSTLALSRPVPAVGTLSHLPTFHWIKQVTMDRLVDCGLWKYNLTVDLGEDGREGRILNK